MSSSDNFPGHFFLRSYVSDTPPENISYFSFLITNRENVKLLPPYATWDTMQSTWAKRFLLEIAPLGDSVIKRVKLEFNNVQYLKSYWSLIINERKQLSIKSMFDDKCLNLVEIAGKSQIQEIEALYNEAPPSGSSEHNTKIALDEYTQHAIEQEALFEDVKLQTPQKRENEIEKVEESDTEFGPEQKKIKPNESDEEESVVSHGSQSQAQQRTPERQFSPSTSVPEVTEPQPMGWEFDEPKPTWLEKVINRQKFLISQTDPSARYESSLNPIWWRIIDASDLKNTSEFMTEADMSELVATFASALNVGHPTKDWIILEPSVERCLQALAKLDNDHLSKVGKIVQLEGSHGAILEIQKMVKNVETSSLSASLFDDEDTNDKVKPTPSVEEEDYLDPDVQFILDLVRFTCEMLAKGIPQRKNSERDIDVFIKRHLFSCFDNILDSHFGEMVSRASRDRRVGAIDAPETTEGYHMDWMFTKHDLAKDLPYGREFSLCERTGSRIENERKILSNTLKAQKTLRDMHRTLIEAISVEGGGMLSKQVLRATTKLLMPGFLSHCFFIRVFLVVYIGGGFYSSVNLADFDIPTTYSELGSIIKVSRIMLQVKKLLNLTVCRFKLMKERASKEKFASGKVLMNARLQEYRSPQKMKKEK